MQIRALTIAGAVEFTPRQLDDERGMFAEVYRFEALSEAVGHPLDLRQVNVSVSQRGVVRGIHYAAVPPSQAKYVTVMHGAVIDYVIDIRLGSPTFGHVEVVPLDSVHRRALYLAEGLGHCFVALEDNTVVSYLTSEVFAPQREHGITPFDESLSIEYPFARADLILSPKDAQAPSLREAERQGLLPTWSACVDFTRALDERWVTS